MEIRRLTIDDVGVVAAIDRSERVDREYEVVEGELRERPVTMVEIPPWTSSGTGPHTVASKIDFCHGLLLRMASCWPRLKASRCLALPSWSPRSNRHSPGWRSCT
jgi:hypothetical protein